MTDFCFIANNQMSQSVACAVNKVMSASIANWAYSKNEQSKAASKADAAGRTVRDKAACPASTLPHTCLQPCVPLAGWLKRGWVSCSYPHSMFTNSTSGDSLGNQNACEIAMKGKVDLGKCLGLV